MQVMDTGCKCVKIMLLQKETCVATYVVEKMHVFCFLYDSTHIFHLVCCVSVKIYH